MPPATAQSHREILRKVSFHLVKIELLTQRRCDLCNPESCLQNNPSVSQDALKEKVKRSIYSQYPANYTLVKRIVSQHLTR